MTKKVTVLIRENGRPINTNSVQEKKEDKINIPHEEEAAAIHNPGQHPDLNSLPSNKKIIKSKKNPVFKLLKPIILTILSAVAVGSILGFIMLRMFGGIGMEPSNDAVVPVTGAPNEAADNNSSETEIIALDPINAFILQGGVYSEESNAVEWQSRFQEAGMPSMLWERDGQTYLLAGIAVTKESGDEIAERFSELDIYIKEWSVQSAELEASAAEKEWLEEFYSTWLHSLEQVENSGTFQHETWQQLAENAPEGNENLKPLITAVREIGQTEGLAGRVQLLELLYAYERVIL